VVSDSTPVSPTSSKAAPDLRKRLSSTVLTTARVLADVGDVARFVDRNRFASWTGTARIELSSGEIVRHWLSRAGNRRMNHMIHIAATTQIRLDTDGRANYRRKLAAGKARTEACDVSSAGSPTPSIDSSAPTLLRWQWTRAREGTAGRLIKPARPAHTRTPALRISHFPDPHPVKSQEVVYDGDPSVMVVRC